MHQPSIQFHRNITRYRRSTKIFKNIVLNKNITILTNDSNLSFLETSKLQRIQIWKTVWWVFNSNQVHSSEKQYFCRFFISYSSFFTQISHPDEAKFFHHFLVHAGTKRLHEPIKNLFTILSPQDLLVISKNFFSFQLHNERSNKYGKLLGTLDYTKPWDTIAIDLKGPLKKKASPKNNKYFTYCTSEVGFRALKFIKQINQKKLLFTSKRVVQHISLTSETSFGYWKVIYFKDPKKSPPVLPNGTHLCISFNPKETLSSKDLILTF